MRKLGIGLDWVSASERPDVTIRIIEVSGGSQLLRYILPFISPAKVEIEGWWGMNEGSVKSFIRKLQEHGISS
jgi:hypothetical protein